MKPKEKGCRLSLLAVYKCIYSAAAPLSTIPQHQNPDFSASIKHGQKSSDPLIASWLQCQTEASNTSIYPDGVLLDSHVPLLDCLASILQVSLISPSISSIPWENPD